MKAPSIHDNRTTAYEVLCPQRTIFDLSNRGLIKTNVEVHPPFSFVLHSCLDESVSAWLSLPIHLC